MTQTIYLVTSGEYSDYSVFAAFATRELADAFCEREKPYRRYDEYRVEEYAMLDTLPDAWTTHHADAILRDDGTVDSVRFWDGDRSVHPEDPYEFRKHDAARGGEYLRVNYYRSEDAARKALYDLAARIKAERAGVA